MSAHAHGWGRDHEFSIPSDALYPRDEQHRLRIYARKGDDLRVLAATDIDGLGLALCVLESDQVEYGRHLSDLGAIGILDAVERRWLIMPWHRDPGRYLPDYDGSATVDAL